MVIFDGHVLAVGDGTEDSIEEYNPKTNSWHLTLQSVDFRTHFGQCCSPVMVELDELLYFIGI